MSYVFIQANREGEPYSPVAEAAERGFAALGYDARRFRPDELRNLSISARTVVVGGMKMVHDALEMPGCRVPQSDSVPAMLTPFLGRKSWRTTKEELLATDTFPVFVKPGEDNKAFTGRVVASADALTGLLEAYPDLPLLAQEPVRFVSEWRVYVHWRRPVGVGHYRGELLAFPSGTAIERVIGAYKPAPAGYSADIGVSDSGQTLLIEVNDGYALGFYPGIDEVRLAELLRARWRELTTDAPQPPQH